MLPDIDLVHLRRFMAVVTSGSFVEAAACLHISQQALSSSIARMEELAGVRFFERRRGGRIALTVFGRLLLARARTQIMLAERMMSEIALLRDARGGSVSIGISETMTGRHVATAIRRYHCQQPDVQIRLVEGYTEAMTERLLSGEVDFVLGSPSHDPQHGPELVYKHLFEVHDVLAVRSGHPLARARGLRLEDLGSYTWLVPAFRGDVYNAISTAYLRAGLMAPRKIIRSDAIVVGAWLCLDDDYILTVSPDMISSYRDAGALAVLDISETTIVRQACAITRRDARLTPAATRLLEEIVFETERQHGRPAIS